MASHSRIASRNHRSLALIGSVHSGSSVGPSFSSASGFTVSDASSPSARARPAVIYTWAQLFRISAFAYLILLALLVCVSLALNEQTLVYSLDDPYIHLSLARTWLRSHTIGISPGQFAPASSSPAWTLLLTTCTWLVGLHDWVPLALNVVCALATLAVFWWGRAQLRGIDRDEEPAFTRFGAAVPRWPLIAAALPILLNLLGLTLCGMEHVLHAALVLAFTVTLWRGLASSIRLAPFLLAVVLPLVRLESMFVIAAAALISLRHRKWFTAIGLLACAGLPVLMLGVWTHAHGAFFLPNPIVAKAVPPQLDALLSKWGYTLLGLLVHPLLVVILGWSLVYRRNHAGLAADGFLFCFVIAALHVVLSTVGGIGLIDRYETYVVDLGLLFVFSSDRQAIATAPSSDGVPLRSRWTAKFERGLVFAGLLERLCLLGTATFATNDIYEQQYQTARFVQQEFLHGSVAVNDIGLVSLRSEGTITDLAGLGSTDVLRALRHGTDTRDLSLAALGPIVERNGADMIAIYTAWFSPRLYAHWQHVASWSLPRPPIVVGDARVDFFAPDVRRARELERRMRAFEPQLPKNVRVAYPRGDDAR